MITFQSEVVLESRTCLLPMVRPEYQGLVSLYGWYKQSVLPFGGGVMDQPAFYLDAMQLIDAVVNENASND